VRDGGRRDSFFASFRFLLFLRRCRGEGEMRECLGFSLEPTSLFPLDLRRGKRGANVDPTLTFSSFWVYLNPSEGERRGMDVRRRGGIAFWCWRSFWLL